MFDDHPAFEASAFEFAAEQWQRPWRAFRVPGAAVGFIVRSCTHEVSAIRRARGRYA